MSIKPHIYVKGLQCMSNIISSSISCIPGLLSALGMLGALTSLGQTDLLDCGVRLIVLVITAYALNVFVLSFTLSERQLWLFVTVMLSGCAPLPGILNTLSTIEMWGKGLHW